MYTKSRMLRVRAKLANTLNTVESGRAGAPLCGDQVPTPTRATHVSNFILPVLVPRRDPCIPKKFWGPIARTKDSKSRKVALRHQKRRLKRTKARIDKRSMGKRRYRVNRLDRAQDTSLKTGPGMKLKPREKFKAAFMNISGGLNSEAGKYECIELWMKTKWIDILVLAETKINKSYVLHRKEYTWYFCGHATTKKRPMPGQYGSWHGHLHS